MAAKHAAWPQRMPWPEGGGVQGLTTGATPAGPGTARARAGQRLVCGAFRTVCGAAPRGQGSGARLNLWNSTAAGVEGHGYVQAAGQGNNATEGMGTLLPASATTTSRTAPHGKQLEEGEDNAGILAGGWVQPGGGV